MNDLGKSLFGQVSVSLPSLIVALGAVALAVAWLEESWLLAAGVALALLVLGVVSYLVGDSRLKLERPKAVSAERWLRWSIAAPIALAAFAGAGLLVLGIATAPKDSWTEQQKQLTAALVAAITTYLTTVFIKGADEADEGWVGTLVKDRFTTRLTDRFPTSEEKVRDAAFSLIRGWDSEERRARATEIDAYIAGGGQVLPRS